MRKIQIRIKPSTIAVFALLSIIMIGAGYLVFQRLVNNINERELLNDPETLTSYRTDDQTEWPSSYEAVSINAAQDSYRDGDEKYYFELVNGSNYKIYFAKKFQYYQDGVWYKVPHAPGIETPAAQFDLPAMETVEVSISLNDYIPIIPGTYRIVVDMDGYYEAEPPYNDYFTIGYIFEVM